MSSHWSERLTKSQREKLETVLMLNPQMTAQQAVHIIQTHEILSDHTKHALKGIVYHAAQPITMNPEQLRKLIRQMTNDTDNDVRIIGNGLNHYAEGVGDEEVIQVTKTALDAFIDICEHLKSQITDEPITVLEPIE